MNIQDYLKEATESFVLPDACFKIQALMEDESSTVQDFANIISIDPSLTSRLLKIANSAIYNFPGEISTISRAISIIGTKSIYNMMLVDVAASAFNQFASRNIDFKRFWRMSIYCGLVSKNLAIKTNIADIERLFVAGLLKDFGELLVAKATPVIAKQCEKYQPKVMPWQLQQHLLGFTYSDITAEMLANWKIPEKVILPIRHFNQARTIHINKDIKVLYLASRLALVDSHPEEFSFDDVIDHKVSKNLALTEADLIEASTFASRETDNILDVMNANFF